MRDTIENLDITSEMANPQKSGMAVASLICSLIICCPLTTVVGPVLGLIALFRFKKHEYLTGKGYAISGIIIGVIATIFWIVASVIVGGLATEFLEETKQVSTESIRSAYDGDYEKFRSYLTKDASHATDAEIEDFVGILQERHGKFDNAFLNLEAQYQKPSASDSVDPIPIRFIFATSDAEGFIWFAFSGNDNNWFEMRINKIEIFGNDKDDIVFPNSMKD